MLREPVARQLKRIFVGIRERYGFRVVEVYKQVTAENAVVEHEVEVIVFVADGDAFLAGLETETGAEFEKEGLEVIQQGFFKISFEVMRALGEAGEFEHVGIADEVGDLAGSFQSLPAGMFDYGFLVRGKPGAFIEQGTDLALELALGPVVFEAFVFVERAFPGVVEMDEFDEMGPRKPQEVFWGERGGQGFACWRWANRHRIGGDKGNSPTTGWRICG